MTALPGTLDHARRPIRQSAIPPLVNGDRLTQPEFHRRYEAMPSHVRAELIGGIVYMASPPRMPYGRTSYLLATIFGVYEGSTPGIEGMDNATAILADDSEPQPDLALRLLPAYGGQTHVNAKDFLVGAPELVVEVADSSVAIDLHVKKNDYRKAGVREYLVLCVREAELRAFDLAADKPLPVPTTGVYKSTLFPGLWIDVPAVLAGDAKRLLAAANKGLKSAAHAAFVKRMNATLAKPKEGSRSKK